MGKENLEELERRAGRHRRRVKNQIICYSIVGVLCLLIVGGCGFGIYKIGSYLEGKRQEAQLQAELEAMEATQSEEIVVSEPEILTPEEPDTVEENPYDEDITVLLENMSLEDKVAGLFFVTPESLTGVSKVTQAGSGTEAALNQYPVGGFLYSAQNILSEEKISAMLTATTGMAKYPMFLGIEELGGAGHSQLAAAKITDAPKSPAEIAQEADSTAAYDAGTAAGAILSRLGFNMEFGPYADLYLNEENTVEKDSTYGGDAAVAAGLVTSMVGGLQDGGVISCLKFFPGAGSTAQDTSAGMAVSERTEEELKNEELVVFQSGIDAGADIILVGNVSYPNVTGGNTPASLSGTIITTLLREGMGYDGVVMSGNLSDKAITEYYAAGEAAVTALQAGTDMLYAPASLEDAYNGVLEAVQSGTLAEERIDESLRRIYRVKMAHIMEG